MFSLSGELIIACADAGAACADEPDIMERLRKAMRATKNHWMLHKESDQLRAGVAGAVAVSEGEERERIISSYKALVKLDAAVNAMNEGLTINSAEMEPPADFIPLMKIWQEIE
jgi:hypothetical protein